MCPCSKFCTLPRVSVLEHGFLDRHGNSACLLGMSSEAVDTVAERLWFGCKDRLKCVCMCVCVGGCVLMGVRVCVCVCVCVLVGVSVFVGGCRWVFWWVSVCVSGWVGACGCRCGLLNKSKQSIKNMLVQPWKSNIFACRPLATKLCNLLVEPHPPPHPPPPPHFTLKK